nr:hypothetical protein [uncultured Rhodopila sp.]
MALTAFNPLQRRGPLGPGSYGYQVAAGEQIWGGGIVGLNAAGTLQRAQTAGTVVLVGIAERDYSNVGVATVSPDWVVVNRGFWVMPVAGATAALIDQPVYATDDGTATMSVPGGGAANPTPVAGNAQFATAGSPFLGLGAAGANTGNGTFGAVTAAETAQTGSYLVLFSAATVFAVYKPDGTKLNTAGATGTAYRDGGLQFTITAGGTAFVSGDSFIIPVASNTSPFLLGTLSGFDKGTPCVRIKGT